jgi:hypothetical protein
LDKEVAEGGQWSTCKWASAVLALHGYIIANKIFF